MLLQPAILHFYSTGLYFLKFFNMNKDTKQIINEVKFHYDRLPSDKRSYSIEYCNTSDKDWRVLTANSTNIATIENDIKGLIEYTKPSAIRIGVKRGRKPNYFTHKLVDTYVDLVDERDEEDQSNLDNIGDIIEEKLKGLSGVQQPVSGYNQALGELQSSFEKRMLMLEHRNDLDKKDREIEKLREKLESTEKELVDAYNLNDKYEELKERYETELTSKNSDTERLKIAGLGLLGAKAFGYDKEEIGELAGLLLDGNLPEKENEESANTEQKPESSFRFKDDDENTGNAETDKSYSKDEDIQSIASFLEELDKEQRAKYFQCILYLNEFEKVEQGMALLAKELGEITEEEYSKIIDNLKNKKDA